MQDQPPIATEELEDGQYPVSCPVCQNLTAHPAADLRDHPQVVCPQCGCLNQIDADEIIDKTNDFWRSVIQKRNER